MEKIETLEWGEGPKDVAGQRLTRLARPVAGVILRARAVREGLGAVCMSLAAAATAWARPAHAQRTESRRSARAMGALVESLEAKAVALGEMARVARDGRAGLDDSASSTRVWAAGSMEASEREVLGEWLVCGALDRLGRRGGDIGAFRPRWMGAPGGRALLGASRRAALRSCRRAVRVGWVAVGMAWISTLCLAERLAWREEARRWFRTSQSKGVERWGSRARLLRVVEEGQAFTAESVPRGGSPLVATACFRLALALAGFAWGILALGWSAARWTWHRAFQRKGDTLASGTLDMALMRYFAPGSSMDFSAMRARWSEMKAALGSRLNRHGSSSAGARVVYESAACLWAVAWAGRLMEEGAAGADAQESARGWSERAAPEWLCLMEQALARVEGKQAWDWSPIRGFPRLADLCVDAVGALGGRGSVAPGATALVARLERAALAGIEEPGEAEDAGSEPQARPARRL